MKRACLTALSFTLMGVSPLLAQNTFFNQGQVHIMANAIVHVNGNMETNGATSVLENEGEITVANSTLNGDFTLDNGSNVFGNGDFLIEGDFSNSPTAVSTFTADPANASLVHLLGPNDQTITGTIATTFFDLELTGPGTIKDQTIDATTSNTLTINLDVELATDVNTHFVTNTAPAAIVNDITFNQEGFVSSLAGGSLSRDMNGINTFNFPVGSSLNTRRFRPVDISPNAANANTFTVRLANNSGTLDGYDVNSLDTSLCRVNPNYYHVINHPNGVDAADVGLFYEPIADGTYDALAQWGTPVLGIWDDMGPVTWAGGQFNSQTSFSWTDFSMEPFALAVSGGVTATIDTTQGGFFGEVVFFDDIGNGANSWSWDFGDGDTSNLQNPNHEFNDPGIYDVMLISTTSSGCADTAFVTVEILESIQIPNVFSPNGDGVNDVFVIPTVGIGEYKLSVYNRWGTLLFESQAAEIVWDGRTFAGEEVPDGVYYYVLTAIGDIDYSTTGHLTLVR